jgi:hypothetical protein
VGGAGGASTIPNSPYWGPGGNGANGRIRMDYTTLSGSGTVSPANGFTAASMTTSAVSTSVSCNGGCNGTATVTASGGTPGYTYNWAPSGGTNATASGLCAGAYTVTVTDAAACTSVSTVTITQPTMITSVTTGQNVTCNGGCNGIAAVNATGGTPGYSYNWLPSGGSGATATGLCAGAYTVTITDANGCTSVNSVTITEPSAMSVSQTQTNVSCNGDCTGSAMVMVSGGSPGYTYNWAPSGGTSDMATGLCAGNYTCVITDVNMCSTSSTFSITEPAVLSVAASSTPDNGSGNGTATANATGGTPGYTYNWAPGGQTDQTATGLTTGTYTVVVTDANGCTMTGTIIVGTSVGLGNTASFEGLLLYPNPVKDVLTISCTLDAAQLITVSVSDVAGRIVSVEQVSGSGSWKYELNVAPLPSGSYFIKVTGSQGSAVQKLTVVH